MASARATIVLTYRKLVEELVRDAFPFHKEETEMNGADQSPDEGVSDPDRQAGLDQDRTKHSDGPPKEGSNRGYEIDEHARANIDDGISGRPPKSHSDHSDDGRADETKADDEEGGDPAQPT